LFHRLHLPEDMSSMYLSVNLSMGVTFGTAKMDLGQCTNYVAYITQMCERDHVFVGEILTKYCCYSLKYGNYNFQCTVKG